MKKLNVLVFAALLMGLSPLSFANQNPKPLSTDPRMRVVTFNQNDVVTVIGSQLISTSLQFGEDETIVGVEGGDKAGWSVDINNDKPNILFIKPVVDVSDTNLTVLTNKYTYHFRLLMPVTNEKTAKIPPTYNIRFTYPLEVAAAKMALNAKKAQEKAAVVADNQTSPLDWNWDYSYSERCSRENVPIRAFDDGTFTYFEFGPNHDNPAIFLVDGQGHESLANWHMKGRYIVVERLSPQFTIRSNGANDASCVFNQHYPE